MGRNTMSYDDMKLRSKELELQDLQLRKKFKELNKYIESVLKDQLKIVGNLHGLFSINDRSSYKELLTSDEHLGILKELKRCSDEKKGLLLLMNDCFHEQVTLSIKMDFEEKSKLVDTMISVASSAEMSEEQYKELVIMFANQIKRNQDQNQEF